ncbi:MAG: chlorite dismutase family protein [archaeon]|nr:MAG: chlorite dismutase family protein [archaeon]
MTEGQGPTDEGKVRYLKYTFFKLSKGFRSKDGEARKAMKADFLSALGRHVGKVGLQCFSLVGLRGDVDFLVVADADDVLEFQALVSDLLGTSLGRYLDVPYSYLALRRGSQYLGEHRHPGQEVAGQSGTGISKFIFVYPFVKKREWYRLPFEERRRMMGDHFRIGHKYPKIKINTGYSFGLDDQEFVLSFEGDDPSDFLKLVEELRGSEASMYTALETPIFTCARVRPERMLDLAG